MDNKPINNTTDPDAKLMEKAAKAGKVVGKVTVRICRITGVFLKSAYLAAKEESKRIKATQVE